MKKGLAMFLALGLCLGMTACGGQTEQTAEGDGLKEVTLVLDYVPNTNHTGIYVAQKSGYFEQHGLKVNIIEPGDNDATTLCAAGRLPARKPCSRLLWQARTLTSPS